MNATEKMIAETQVTNKTVLMDISSNAWMEKHLLWNCKFDRPWIIMIGTVCTSVLCIHDNYVSQKYGHLNPDYAFDDHKCIWLICLWLCRFVVTEKALYPCIIRITTMMFRKLKKLYRGIFTFIYIAILQYIDVAVPGVGNYSVRNCPQ